MNRRVGWILAGLVVLVILVMALSSRIAQPELRLNSAAPAETVQVGAYGPLLLTFSEPMQVDSLEAAFLLDPPLSGRFSWNGEDSQSVAFWPDLPLVPGQRYSLRIQTSLKSARGTGLRTAQNWQIEVRQPELLYLAPSRAPELWQMAAGGSDDQRPRQLTETGGKVYDYSVAPDGSRILFSTRNDEGGIDLWELPRGTTNPELLLPCGTDWCFEAVYSPDQQRIAYSRRTYSGLPGSAPGVARVWLYDRAAKSTDALLANPELGGSSAAWSPDGRYLAFTDPISQTVRVVDFQEKSDFFVRAGADSRVAWSPRGGSFWMTKPESSEDYPYVLVYEVDVTSQQARLWNAENGLSQVDYSLPIPTPDGSWLAFSRRLVGDGPGKQLYVIPIDESELHAVTDDPLANFAGYQWDPTSSRLVFQRLSFSGSSSLPEVILWERASGQQTRIAEDAFQPRWLP